MSAIDDIVASLPMANLAAQVGSDEQNTESAVRQVLPALLGGLHANAQDPAGAASLAGALDQHSPALVDGGVDLDQVNPDEGSKIVQNIFGGNTEQVAHTLGGSLQGQTGLVQQLLPILAPIVLSYLAKRIGGQAAGGGGGLADVLGGMLGGGGAASSGGLGSVLGGLLGGAGSGQQAPGGLGDVLGGLLGGGRR
jgi:hypothetical protein